MHNRDVGKDELDIFIEDQLEDDEFRSAYIDAENRNLLLSSLIGQRRKRKLSQAVVAQRMHTTQSAVSDLESGATDPRLSTIQRYARAIGCHVEVLLKESRDSSWKSGISVRAVESKPGSITQVVRQVARTSKTSIVVSLFQGRSHASDTV